MRIEVTSVSKEAEPLNDAAASIFVITRDDILRAGAQSIPDMLRLAPNLEVAQITSTKLRHHGARFQRSGGLQAPWFLIDGRTVYTPYHSGVAWDVQDAYFLRTLSASK